MERKKLSMYITFVDENYPSKRTVLADPVMRCVNFLAVLETRSLPRDDPMLTGGLSLFLRTRWAAWMPGRTMSLIWDTEKVEERSKGLPSSIKACMHFYLHLIPVHPHP